MRASAISPLPMSTSDVAKPSCYSEKGSNATPSNSGACNTDGKPLKIHNQTSQKLQSSQANLVSNHLMTDTLHCGNRRARNGHRCEKVGATQGRHARVLRVQQTVDNLFPGNCPHRIWQRQSPPFCGARLSILHQGDQSACGHLRTSKGTAPRDIQGYLPARLTWTQAILPTRKGASACRHRWSLPSAALFLYHHGGQQGVTGLRPSFAVIASNARISIIG